MTLSTAPQNVACLVFVFDFAEFDNFGEIRRDRVDVVLQTFVVRLQQRVLRGRQWLRHGENMFLFKS